MEVECGKDSAGDAARKGFRAERTRVRPGKDSGTERSYLRMPTQSRGHGTRRSAIQKHARKTRTSCDGRDQYVEWRLRAAWSGLPFEDEELPAAP